MLELNRTKAAYKSYENIKLFKWISILVLISISSLWVSLKNYQLFHTTIEIYSIYVAFMIFMIIINTHKIYPNSCFILIGISFGFSGIFEFLHTISFKDIGVFHGNTMNLSIQFRIVAAYIESIALMVSFSIFNKSVKVNKILLFYSITSILLVLSLYWSAFPKCFIAGEGPTVFKNISEAFIITSLVAAILLLVKNRKTIHEGVFNKLIISIIAVVASEISFVFFTDIYNLSNVAGHIFKLISYYLIYKAMVETSLKQPYNTLFYNLNNINKELRTKTLELETANIRLNKENQQRRQAEETLAKSEERYRTLVELLPDALFIHSQGKIVFANIS